VGEARTTLFIASKSPAESPGFETTLRLARKGDAIAFIHDGVYFSQGAGRFAEALQAAVGRGVSLHYLKPDLDARGVPAGEGSVDYDELLDLIEEHSSVFS